MTATDATRNVSRLLPEVELGKSDTITSNGKDVMVLSPPAVDSVERANRSAGLEVLKKRWAIQPHVVVGPWTRDEICNRF